MIKTEYEYINFVRLDSKPLKTLVFSCRSKRAYGHELGIVKWYAPWRQYCYFPTNDTIYNGSCLEDIKYFMKQLMETR